MDRVHTIRLEIPQNDSLFSFLEPLFVHRSQNLLPRAIMYESRIESPLVSFDTENKHSTQTLRQENLTFGFNVSAKEQPISEYSEKSSIDLGEIVEFVNIERVIHAFQHSEKSLNHFGINLSPKRIKENDYITFRSNLAERCNLYSYPTNEEWSFLIPATPAEFKNKIQDDTLDRNPKFELVYSDYHPDPLIQFDIETQFTRSEVEKLFPSPYGVSLFGLENQFRSVFVKTQWCGVLLRLDLRFPGKTKDFGYWIVKNGKRL